MLVATYPKEEKSEQSEWAAMKFDFFREKI